MIRTEIKRALASAIAATCDGKIGDDQCFSLLEHPKNREHGELSIPCFQLAKLLAVSPPECAKRIAAQVTLPAGVSEVTPLGPFLNFRLERKGFSERVLNGVLKAGLAYGSGKKREQITVIEYSAPNIAKPFHVGHLRGTLIGNALDRVHRHLGYNVVSVNHLGDWGTQFGFVYAGCEVWGRPAEPTVAALVELYRRATSLRASQDKNEVAEAEKGLPKINEMARAYFVDLELGKEYAVNFWQWCLDISMEYFLKTYSRLNVKFDHYTGESFYSDKLEGVKKLLDDAGVLKESQGALGVDLGEELGFARIYTPDGRSLYLTRDLATAKYRAETFNFDRSIYVVGAPQTLHFKQIKGVLKAIGVDYWERMLHVPFGHVAGMSTRGAGEFVELNDFLDEAFSRALTTYREQVTKRPPGLDEQEVAEAVSHGAIVFSTLNRGCIKDVHFSWETALNFQGDSGPYLLYSAARISGIKERAAQAGITPATTVRGELLPEESAFQLIVLLENFPEILERTAAECEPLILTSFAIDLASQFSKAYNELQVVGAEKDVAEARLALFEATRATLTTSMKLLGMRVVERM